MPEYADIFPHSPAAVWDRNQALRSLKDYVAIRYYGFAERGYRRVFARLHPECIPIIVINFNRLEALQQLIEWLRSSTSNIKIIVLDNHSTFKPLLAYYASLPAQAVEVIYLKRNRGPQAVLKLVPSLRRFHKYVVTDSDLIPFSTTPGDMLAKLSDLLDRYPEYNHAGASLEIADLPTCYPFHRQVQEWEGRYWAHLVNGEAYEAAIDTTFAMYRGNSDLRRLQPALRLARPYTLKHVDWYVNPEQVSEEYAYYLGTCSCVATWATKWNSEHS
ncbi:glycosyltransferase [Hymenobacter wooponensis]|uniref:Glycosyltransferase n=1 Tax=Hymenobacter wooponensis TaxID=1525360 RepID=A0A4Z0MSV9_9BACT|nr:glycosyltransferase [Hymenobacter wooponensis]TGD82694.1 glycosyltransferase [Hymenobacter wooponensis]